MRTRVVAIVKVGGFRVVEITPWLECLAANGEFGDDARFVNAVIDFGTEDGDCGLEAFERHRGVVNDIEVDGYDFAFEVSVFLYVEVAVDAGIIAEDDLRIGVCGTIDEDEAFPRGIVLGSEMAMHDEEAVALKFPCERHIAIDDNDGWCRLGS